MPYEISSTSCLATNELQQKMLVAFCGHPVKVGLVSLKRAHKFSGAGRNSTTNMSRHPQRRNMLPAPLLNPGLLPSHKLQCFSVACLDMPHLEFGDKIVLPSKVLLELQCLKIATPLLFKVRAVSVEGGEHQYCSVQEFSAPEGQVFLPYWLMQNLHVPEGGSVVVESVVNIPRGVYCRLQPESKSFLDLAADIGPKLLMETALRRYSVLSVNSTIVVEHGSVRYYVRIVELKPASVVSLCGDVDLVTDFMPPAGSDPKRPTPARLNGVELMENEPTAPSSSVDVAVNSNDGQQQAEANCVPYGRRLCDGGYVDISQSSADKEITVKSRKLPLNGLVQAQKNVHNQQKKTISTERIAKMVSAISPALAVQLRQAQGSFSTPGQTLGSRTPVKNQTAIEDRDPDPAKSQTSEGSAIQQCTMCLADVSPTNMELHILRCAKNPAYHRFQCSVCREKILRVDEDQHYHCSDCKMVCDSIEALARHRNEEHTASCKCTLCGGLFTRTKLHDHVKNRRCEYIFVPCLLCGLSFKQKDIDQHSRVCSSRTERCDSCEKYINITEFDAHQTQCQVSSLLSEQPDAPVLRRSQKPSDPSQIECVYCSQGGFTTIAAVEHHVTHDCRVARVFATSISPERASTNQDDATGPQSAENTYNKGDVFTRPLLAQGRMRRRDDATVLRRTPPSKTPPNLSTRQENKVSGSSKPPRRGLVGIADILQSADKTLSPSSRQPLKHRKAKPRPSPQLHPLPLRSQNQTFPPSRHNSSSRSLTSTVDLCISSIGSNLSHTTALQPSKPTSRSKRRPTHRLDKL